MSSLPPPSREGLPALPAAGAARRIPIAFWLLVAFSLLAIATGVWWLAAGSSGTQAAAEPQPVRQPAAASNFQLKDLAGKPVRLSDLRGKVVLLNFWATWCPPCKAEMPDLEALYREHASPHNFVVLAVDDEEELEQVQAFVKEYELTFPVVLDSDGQVIEKGYLVRALPTSFIIDREGKVRYTWTGQQSRQTMLSRLQTVW